MNKKLKVAVLMGGKSSEHEISLISGREVVKNLDPRKYEITPIVIPKKGFSLNFRFPKVDLAFIALHGSFGEDGTIQGFLELQGIKYTGSGILASALGIHKIYSRKLFTQAGLKVPKTLIFKRGQKVVLKGLDYPLFVKPNSQGSSVGIFKVYNQKELEKAILSAFKFDDLVLIEEYLKGTEITGAVLGNDKPQVLPLVEINPKKDFFDYEAKYSEKLTDEIVPARINAILTKKAQSMAISAYQTISCRGFGRVDMIIKDDQIYVLEINTIPGLTPVSLFPKAAKAAGISYRNLLDKIIYLGLES